MIQLIKVTRHKMEFWKATLQYVTKTVCASTKNNTQVISMCVVSVVIKHKDSAKEIITHAILNSCSQGMFIVEDLVMTA